MRVKFSETALEADGKHLKLVDQSGTVLLELKAHEIDDAIRGGFIDPSNYHYSMFEYARMRHELRTAWKDAEKNVSGPDPPERYDSTFLAGLHIQWDDKNDQGR